MRSILLSLALLGASAPAFAALAFFTGEMHMVRSVTGAMVWNCKYQYAGQYFWRAYQLNCPASIEVE